MTTRGLERCRTELAMSVKAFAVMAGIGVGTLLRLERGELSPVRGGDWTDEARAVADAHGLGLTELFPGVSLGPDVPVGLRPTDPTAEPVPDPEELTALLELRRDLDVQLCKIGGLRERAVRMRHGLDPERPGAELTLAEIGEVLERSKERVRRMDEEALLVIRRFRPALDSLMPHRASLHVHRDREDVRAAEIAHANALTTLGCPAIPPIGAVVLVRSDTRVRFPLWRGTILDHRCVRLSYGWPPAVHVRPCQPTADGVRLVQAVRLEVLELPDDAPARSRWPEPPRSPEVAG